MKGIVLVVFIWSSVIAYAGQCDVFRVNVFPHGNEIRQNNIFLITYREAEYKLKSHLNNVAFEAVNQRGALTKMKIADTAFGGNYGQIVLMPVKKLSLNDTVTIYMRWIDTTKKMKNAQYFQSAIGRYFVTGKTDKAPPIWLTDSIKVATNFQFMQSSAPGFAVVFKMPASDRKDKTVTPLVYKVHTGTLSFFYQSTDMTFFDWSGFCECDIPLQTNTHYTADVTLIDMSGNRNMRHKEISFSIPQYTDAIRIDKDR